MKKIKYIFQNPKVLILEGRIQAGLAATTKDGYIPGHIITDIAYNARQYEEELELAMRAFKDWKEDFLATVDDPEYYDAFFSNKPKSPIVEPVPMTVEEIMEHDG